MKTLNTVQVQLGDRSYPIRIGRDCLSELAHEAREVIGSRRCVVISNPDIGATWAGAVMDALECNGMTVDLFNIAEGEAHKTLDAVSQIYDFMIGKRSERRTAIIALGGGVVGDIVGFAAATFLRGVPLVQLPTSLLAMVDSSVGGKTGVNHRLGKNLIGAFKQPLLVGIDLEFLDTLPEAEFRAGMAEVVKYGVIADAEFFDYLENHASAIMEKDETALTHIIARSCELKAWVVGEDEQEQGLRAILNFGHTFAHAVETLTDYSAIRHGEAVAMGMIAACRLGERITAFPAEATAQLESLLERLGLPVRLPRYEAQRYLEVMRVDKKVKSGKIRFVLPEAIGKVSLRDDVADEAVIDALHATFVE